MDRNKPGNFKKSGKKTVSRGSSPKSSKHGRFNNDAQNNPRREKIRRDNAGAVPPVRRAESSAKPAADSSAAAYEDSGMIAGRNAVRELLAGGRSVDKLLVQEGVREGSLGKIIADARERAIPVIETARGKLDAAAGTIHHQGVIAMAAAKNYCDYEDIIAYAEERGETPLIVIGDCIEDPYNLGALIRCAEGAGAHGLIIPKRRASGLTSHAFRASSGAAEHLRLAKVANTASTIEALKTKGFWIFGADMDGEKYYECDLNIPAVIVFGGENKGLGSLIRSKCDFLVSVPMYGRVNSLNVAASAAVILSEVARQRAAGTPPVL